MRGTNPERFFDQVARTLAEPMPRRRAVRLIGVSLVAVAVPGVSPRVSRAMIAAGAKCPDGSTCNPGDLCCSERPSPLSGSYTCRKPTQICCCGNTQCDTATERCICPVGHGNPGGQCAKKCGLAYGPHWTDCGLDCCPPYKRCKNGKCVACEDEGKQTCGSYDNKSSHECCKKGTKCCADMTHSACCGPAQTCKPAGRNRVACKCNDSTDTKCGSDCCNKGNGEFCCDGEKCCNKKKGEFCFNGECCPKGAVECDLDCCDPAKNEFCLAKKTRAGQSTLNCQKGCSPGNRCGPYCCGTGTTCVKGKCV